MKKILVIDDTPEIINNVTEYLALSNHTVIYANDGKTGIELAVKEIPDLIICDIMMPGLDGYGVLHALQKKQTTKNIPFIFLTAKSGREDLRKGMELGADDYISKPFNGAELLNAVNTRLNKAAEMKESFDNQPCLESTDGLRHVIASLIHNRDINTYKNKQIVFSEGNRPNCLFYVKTGKIKTYKINNDGKELIINLYRPGDFLGLVALLENTNYKDTAETMEQSELAVIPKGDFDDFMRRNKAACTMFARLLAAGMSQHENRLVGLAYNSLRKKVAAALLTIYQIYKDPKSTTFNIEINRESLATLAGTATESLIRTLADFKAEKLVDIKESNITILNVKELEGI
ncbi:MAG TPA: response regulator [Chitinophagaceae bacterium]|nr:response regulator [Chitinophagaceae bacterium]